MAIKDLSELSPADRVVVKEALHLLQLSLLRSKSKYAAGTDLNVCYAKRVEECNLLSSRIAV